MQQTGYEFTSEQNKVLGGLTSLMTMFAYSLFLMGGLQAVFICTTAPRVAQASRAAIPLLAVVSLAGVVGMALALLLKKAASDFVMIIKTQGNDIDHLMQALGKLRKFFRYTAIVGWILALVLLLTLGQQWLGA